jgi:hypothetical protein
MQELAAYSTSLLITCKVREGIFRVTGGCESPSPHTPISGGKIRLGTRGGGRGHRGARGSCTPTRHKIWEMKGVNLFFQTPPEIPRLWINPDIRTGAAPKGPPSRNHLDKSCRKTQWLSRRAITGASSVSVMAGRRLGRRSRVALMVLRPPRPQVPPGRSGRVLPWCRRSSSASCCSTSSFMSATHSACVFSDLELVLWLLLSLAWQYGRAILAASTKQSNLAGRSAYGGRLAVAEGDPEQPSVAKPRHSRFAK